MIRLSFKHFNEWINRYAHYFISLGLKKGDIVKIMMTNRPEYIIILYALGKIGAIGSLINIDLREMSLVHCLKLTSGKCIIIDEKCFNNFNAVKSDLELSNDQILLFLPDQGFISTPEGYIDLSLAVKDFPTYNPSTTSEVKTTDDIAYLFTSGTTGFPKATIMRHYTLISSYYFYGRGICNLTPEDTMYISLPLFHANAIGAGCAAALGSGAAVAIGRKFSVSNFWEEIRKYKATAFNYIGEVCRYLMNQPPRDDDSDNKWTIETRFGKITNKTPHEEGQKEDLVDRLVCRACCDYGNTKPGTLIEKLCGRDRELVKKLTSKDFNRRICG